MRDRADEPDVPGVIAPPPLIFGVGLATGFVFAAFLPATPVAAPVAGVLGGALLVAGAVLARSFVVAFRRIATPMSPYVAPTALVTSGVYRRTRNPGYLGMALACCGMAVVTGELWALAPLPLVLLVVDRGVVAREERCLTARFGPEYLRYKSATRRWL